MPVQMPREVRQVRDALKREFETLIDMSDVPGTGENFEQHFLSRALAALVVRRLLGCDSQTAADSVVDGRNDIGIDAVAVADSGTRIWLIQSKWSDKGKAGFGVAEVLKLCEGLHFIDEAKFDRFNAKIQDRAELLRSAWAHPDIEVTLVVAVMGDGGLSADVIDRFEDLKRDFNSYSDVLDYDLWDARRIWQIIRDDQTESPVKVIAKLDQWMHLAEPFEAYQGRIPASEIAEWYSGHGDRLFEQNIRKSLGLTRVNQELVDTLVANPEDFWYYNNGITVLCDSADRVSFSKAAYSPIQLTLMGASVVNGAQTVAAIHTAMQNNEPQASRAYVSIKVVTTENCPPDFGRSVTRATNTQNQVEPRDFVALDPVQWAIREDFALTLNKEYAYKRGELDPAPDAGCSVTQAAIALACAHSNSELAVRTKISRDTLWESGSTSTYEILFHRVTPAACQIWRSFQVLRQVQSWLAGGQEERAARASAIASHGDLLIVHLVFRRLTLDVIDDLDYDWSIQLTRIPELANAALGWLIYRVDEEFGSASFIKGTFTNADRCRVLVQRVLADMVAGVPVPALPAEYRPSVPERRLRRQKAVATLVDAGCIAEGTTILFEAKGQREQEWVNPWLAVDPKRGQATWVNHRGKPLLWAYDGQRYSPTGLVTKIWESSGWPDHPVAVQGPTQWHVPGEGSLWDIAKTIQDDEEQHQEED
ncbi:MAG TPA: AIPR family protein [Trebonia sp.]|nr:AIPR family protein [Trebonia sp.]